MKLIVQCKYPKCGKTAEPAEAKRTYKVCHNCDYVYCSRDCRRQHWQKHRKLCLNSRVGDLCRRILSAIVQNNEIVLLASRVARKGFLAHGRGCVKFYFHTPRLAEQFLFSSISPATVAAALTHCPQPAFNKWADLLPAEIGNELYGELSKLCKSYNADRRFVLVVAIHVVSDIPSSDGTVKYERQIISRFVKTKLSPELMVSGNTSTDASEQPQTLILTSLPSTTSDRRTSRRVNFTNIQRHLRARGVELRKQFPDVYKKLCDYVENDECFAATTIYPVDATSGKTFMCVIMPDTEPEKLDLFVRENRDTQTIDVASSTISESSD